MVALHGNNGHAETEGSQSRCPRLQSSSLLRRCVKVYVMSITSVESCRPWERNSVMAVPSSNSLT